MDLTPWSVTLRLEGVMAHSPMQVARGMIAAANHLGLPVSCNVNGAELVASPDSTTLEDLERSYEILLNLPDANRAFNPDGTRREQRSPETDAPE